MQPPLPGHQKQFAPGSRRGNSFVERILANRRIRGVLLIAAVGVTAAVAAAGAWSIEFFWPRKLPDFNRSGILTPVISGSHVDVIAPGYVFIGDIGLYDDELFAFLMFDHYRSLRALNNKVLYLTSVEHQGKPEYRISLKLPASLADGIGELSNLEHEHLIQHFDWRWIRSDALGAYDRDTSVFIDTWTAPLNSRLRKISRNDLQKYLRRFIRFKSVTDPRIEGSIEPVPSPLSKKDASRLAADIIAVADFYDLPLDLLLGIGAMENNFMNVPGDLHNAIWKSHPEKGDIVLRRRRGRVLVRNDSLGVSQITRESLRYAHRLFLADKRDYSLLPQRLRLPRVLDIDDVSSEQLTTYAGLLLRDLLDRFHGDVKQAAGAYNGGIGKPNEHYAAGVQIVAEYARRILQNAAAHNAVTSEEVAHAGLENRAARKTSE